MKHHSLPILAIAVAILFTAGCSSVTRRSVPENHVRLTSETVLAHDDTRVWSLTVETRNNERFRIVGDNFDLFGDTAAEPGNSTRSQATLWIAETRYSDAENVHVRTVVKGQRTTVSVNRRIPAGDQSGLARSPLPDGHLFHRLNEWIELGPESQSLRVMVGSAVSE